MNAVIYVYSVNFLLCIPTLNVTENFKKAVPENNILKGKLKKDHRTDHKK